MANILVIDDDAIVRDAVGALLSRAGHEVRFAADGGNGIIAYKCQRPDLVILDRNLPVVSGSGVFDCIRAHDPGARIIVLSGYADPEEAAAYIKCGAKAFLSKGDGLSNVLKAVDEAVGPAPESAGPAASRRPVALVADDEKLIRKILRRLLEEVGCRVLEAEDGETAERLALEHRPAIVMLDVKMPNRDGIQVLRDLLPQLPGAGFIVITGFGEEASGREALQLGAADYLPKPFNPDMLKLTVEATLLQQGRLGDCGY